MEGSDIDDDMDNRENFYDRFGRSWDKDDMFFETLPASWRIPRVRTDLPEYPRRPMFADMDDGWRRPSFDDPSQSTGKERIIPIQVERDEPEQVMVDSPCRPTHRAFAGLAATRASSCPPAPAELQRQRPLRHASGDSTATTSVPSSSKACQQIARVAEAVKELAEQVDGFRGSREQRQFRYLDEMLTRQLLSLDDVDTNGEAAARAARRQVVVRIQETLARLEAAATSSADGAKEKGSLQGRESSEPTQVCEDGPMADSETAKQSGEFKEGNGDQTKTLDDTNEQEERCVEGEEKHENNNNDPGKKEEETNERKDAEQKTENESDTENLAKTQAETLTETSTEETVPNVKPQEPSPPPVPESSVQPDSSQDRVESAGSDGSEQNKVASPPAEDAQHSKQNS